MTRHWTPLAVVYLVLAVAGLVVTWTFNAIAIAEGNDFIGDLLSSGSALTAFAFTFPLWLAMRERRLAARRAESGRDETAPDGAV